MELFLFLYWQIDGSPQPVVAGPTPAFSLTEENILIVSADDPQLGKYFF